MGIRYYNQLPPWVIAPVSMSGGIGNGGIIERGSNANGEYTKYADGTMESWVLIDITSMAITTASGSNFTPAAQLAVSFPAFFVSPPVIAGSVQRGAIFASGIHLFSNFNGSAGIVPWTSISLAAATAKILHLKMEGRWV